LFDSAMSAPTPPLSYLLMRFCEVMKHFLPPEERPQLNMDDIEAARSEDAAWKIVDKVLLPWQQILARQFTSNFLYHIRILQQHKMKPLRSTPVILFKAEPALDAASLNQWNAVVEKKIEVTHITNCTHDTIMQPPQSSIIVKQMAQQVRRNRTLDYNANKTIDFKVAKMKDEIDTYKMKFNDLMATTRVILRNSPIEVMTGESSTSSTSNTNSNTDQQQLSPKRTRNRDKKSSISRQSSQLEEELHLILTSPETEKESQNQVNEEISFLMEPIRLYMEEVPVEYFTVD